MKAYLKRVRISPKKANLVACLIRGKNATEALDILKFTPKRAAGILHKLLKSAIANAEHNSKQDKDKLVVKEVVVTQGPTYKRSIPISALSMTHCSTFHSRNRQKISSTAASSKSRRWHSCEAARSTTLSSYWMKRRTPQKSR